MPLPEVGIPELHLRPLRVSEAEDLLGLQVLCYQSEAALYEDHHLAPLRQSLGELLAEYDTHVLLGAFLGAELVGSVRAQLRDGRAHVGRLIVHPRLQGRGLGTRLMHAVEDALPQAAHFELFTGHRSEGNLRLYRRLGYQEVRREAVSPRLTLVYLEKRR